MSVFSLGPVEAGAYAGLLALWERSVRATHLFLSEEDIAFFRPRVMEAFGAVELTAARDEKGLLAGFVGLHGQSPKKMEMLFVDPAFFRRGAGKLLLRHAVAAGATELDVNEQNPGALRFYLSQGFVVHGRSALDDTGGPFPLLHLRLASRGEEG